MIVNESIRGKVGLWGKSVRVSRKNKGIVLEEIGLEKFFVGLVRFGWEERKRGILGENNDWFVFFSIGVVLDVGYS